MQNLQRLRQLVDTPSVYGIEAETLGWLSRLLIVRSCGYLEQAVIACARGYVDERAGGLVRAFSRTWLERTSNPSPAALMALAGRFDQNLREELEELLEADDQRLLKELHILVNLRNRIAHGENEGVGRPRALALSSVSEELSNWWILSFNPG